MLLNLRGRKDGGPVARTRIGRPLGDYPIQGLQRRSRRRRRAIGIPRPQEGSEASGTNSRRSAMPSCAGRLLRRRRLLPAAAALAHGLRLHKVGGEEQGSPPDGNWSFTEEDIAFREPSEGGNRTHRTVNELETYNAGRIIIREGRVGAAFFMVVSGRVEVFNDASSSVILATFVPGDFFGEIATVKHLPRSASVRAIEDTECLVIWRSDFEGFISQFPEAAAKIKSVARVRSAGVQDGLNE